MKRLFTASVTVLVLVFAAFGQSTRPRVAPTAAPTPYPLATPPVIQDDPYPQTTGGAPPVLRNGSNRPQPAPTATPGNAGDDEVIKVETNLVTMPVSVLDRDGRFISGLQQKDFQIFEDGKQQKIEYFQSVEQPFTVILLLDVSPSTQFKIEEIQNAAISFVNQLRPGDRVQVIAFDQYVHILTNPTNNRYQLQQAIRQAEFGDGTSLYEAVDQVLNREMNRIDGRKAVVLFTDGVDTTSRRASYDSTVKDVEESEALFYTIRYDTSGDMGGGGGGWGYPRGGGRRGGTTMADIIASIMMGGGGPVYGGRGSGRGNVGAEYEKGHRYLEALAQASGGREFEAQSMYNVDAAFSGIAEELRRQYSLGYYPDQVGQVGDRKQIKIRVMRPEVVVRAKTSYIVGQTDRKIAGK